MPDSALYALHRPEIADALVRGDEKVRNLFKGTARTIPAGTTLIEGFSQHNMVHRMTKGWTGRVRTLADGRSQFILIFLPGDLFGVKSMFMAVHSDTVVALSDCVVEQVDYRQLRAAYSEDSDVSIRCTWQVMEEERRLHNWIVSLGSGSAEERLALILVEFHGRLVLSGTIEPGATEFDLPLTQQQLGDHIGVTSIHVNRVLRSLRERNVAIIRDRRVIIQDMDALFALAEPLLDVHQLTEPSYRKPDQV